MNHKLTIRSTTVSLVCILSFTTIGLSQDAVYSTLFRSLAVEQWETSGYVTPEIVDGELTFLFTFHDIENPVRAYPDTVTLIMRDHIDLSSCQAAYIRSSKEDITEHPDSWIHSDVRIYARHEHSPRWFRVYEDITELASWIHNLELKFRVAVRTDDVYPGSFRLKNLRVEGICGP